MKTGAEKQTRIACFVSPHGYGHAARASAVMAAIQARRPEIEFEIFTRLEPAFFTASLEGRFRLHDCLTDVGLAQQGPLRFDLPETVAALDRFLPFDPGQVRCLAGSVRESGCGLVLCDISPLGIAVARLAGVPSVLLENFTWDWIYEGFLGAAPGLARHADYLREVFAQADYHVQAEPVCRPGAPDLVTRPIGRTPRSPGPALRQALGIPRQTSMVLVTLGGIPGRLHFLDELRRVEGVFFVLPGPLGEPGRSEGNLVFPPRHGAIYHPDLVAGADAVVGKAGYSTLAEIFYAGVPFGYVANPRFREAPVLAAFIERHLSGLPIAEADFARGSWIASLPDLLRLPRGLPRGEGGAEQAARFLLGLLD